MQTQFKFEDGLYNFWLIHWFDPNRGSTLIRCEELQSPLIRIEQIKAERDIRYRQCEMDVDRFLSPWKSLHPCQIENDADSERVKGWLAKFGEKNGYLGLAITDKGEIPFGYLIENEQINLFDKKD